MWLMSAHGTPGPPELLGVHPRWQVALVVACLLGLVVQVAMLPLRGTGDVRTFKEWGVSSLETGLPNVYRLREAPGDDSVTPDYPPLSVGLLSAVTRLVGYVDGVVQVESRLLTFYVKLLALTGGLVGSGLLWWYARARTGDSSLAFFWGAAYFLNPARVVNGPLLGYLDGPCLAAGVAGMICAGRGRPVAATLLAVSSALIKPQGVFFLLPVAVMAWGSGRAVRAAASGATLVLLVCLPFLLASGPHHFGLAMLVNLREDMLLGNALNLWWLVTVAMRIGQYGRAVFDMRIELASVTEFLGATGIQPRLLMAAVVAGTAVWLGWRLRGTRLLTMAAAYMALVVHLYFVLAVSVHENHLIYAAVPLLIVAVEQREYRWLALAVSLLTALNMALFYGVGRDWSEIPRVGLFLPITVALAGANVVLLVVHGRLYARLTGLARLSAAA